MKVSDDIAPRAVTVVAVVDNDKRIAGDVYKRGAVEDVTSCCTFAAHGGNLDTEAKVDGLLAPSTGPGHRHHLVRRFT
jgi:hypothetical protein